MQPQRGCQGVLHWLAFPMLLIASLLAGCSGGARAQAPLHDLHLPGVAQISSIQTLSPQHTDDGRPFGGVIEEAIAYTPSPPSASFQGDVSTTAVPFIAGRRLPITGDTAPFHVVILRDNANAYDVASDGNELHQLDVLPSCLNRLDVTPDGWWLICSDRTVLYSYALVPAASALPSPRIAPAGAAGVRSAVKLSWAPDSLHFAATTNAEEGGCAIGIFAASAARDRVDLVAHLAFPEFATTTSLGGVGCTLDDPAWSPDGAWLAFSAGDAPSSLYALALASVLPDGLPTRPAMLSATVALSQLIFLGTSDSFVPGSWRKGTHGKSVTVVDGSHRRIVDIDPATHRQTTLLQVDEGEIDTLSWTRDGQHLVFAQGQPFCPDCQLAYTPSKLYVYTPSAAGTATPSATP